MQQRLARGRGHGAEAPWDEARRLERKPGAARGAGSVGPARSHVRGGQWHTTSSPLVVAVVVVTPDALEPLLSKLVRRSAACTPPLIPWRPLAAVEHIPSFRCDGRGRRSGGAGRGTRDGDVLMGFCQCGCAPPASAKAAGEPAGVRGLQPGDFALHINVTTESRDTPKPQGLKERRALGRARPRQCASLNTPSS